MSNFAGRLSTVSVLTTAPSTFTAMPGLLTRSIRYNAATIDVTDSESTDLFQQLLAGGGVKSFEVSFSGLLEANAALTKMATDALVGGLNTYRFFVPGFGTFDGVFALTSYSMSGGHDGAMAVEFSLSSSGKPTFTVV